MPTQVDPDVQAALDVAQREAIAQRNARTAQMAQSGAPAGRPALYSRVPDAQSNYRRFGVNPPYIHGNPYSKTNAQVIFNPDGSYRIVDMVAFPSQYPLVANRYPSRIAEALLGPFGTGRVFDVPKPPAPARGGGGRAVAQKQETPPPVAQAPQETPAEPTRPPATYAIPNILSDAENVPPVVTTRQAGGVRGTETAQRSPYGGGDVSDGATAALEALGDMYNASLATGQRPVLRRSVDYMDAQGRYAPTGLGQPGSLSYAIQLAQAQGADRSGLIGQIERTARLNPAYQSALQQQSGRSGGNN